MSSTFNHYTVLKYETIINTIPSENLLASLQNTGLHTLNIVDSTLGGGGHAETLLQILTENPSFKNFKINLIMFDQDINAIEFTKKKLAPYATKSANINLIYINENFKCTNEFLESKFPNEKIHALYADFGVSSPQLDLGERGFSLIHDGPLDMRMNPSSGLTAKDVLATYSEEELTKLLFDYGEEPKARKLAKAIVADRKKDVLPLTSTIQFANYVKRVLAYPNSRIHPATRTFQAIRIEVNQELDAIKTLLQEIPRFIHPLAKVGFISFHSLEDRLVKHAMRNWQKGKYANVKQENKKDFHFPLHMHLHLEENQQKGFGKENPRGGIIASEKECQENNRSRSARLRCFEFSNITED